jgi:hypothetical protein
MKILYISAASGPDYQCDMLFHGLRTLLGSDVVDSKKISYMYKDYSNTHKFEDLYGKGFSVYGLLDNMKVDREDLALKIKSKFFDLVIYGSIHRSQEFILDVLESYEPRNIFFIDGEDEADHIFWPLVGRGHYLKREIVSSSNLITPIQFAIPYEKVAQESIEKTQQIAKIDPRDKSTYIYSQEREYYLDYRSSLFAYTTKKAGWDCLRHYEILGNGCIPLFLDLQHCPTTVCTSLPKELLTEYYHKSGLFKLFEMDKPADYNLERTLIANRDLTLLNNVDLSENFYYIYLEYLEKLLQYTKQNLTTKALAQYILR